MFAKATRNFLKEVDAGGNLIAVTNLNDSDKLQLLSLVTKKKEILVLAETQVPVFICHPWRCTHRRPISESSGRGVGLCEI